jgi:hypothetical protein
MQVCAELWVFLLYAISIFMYALLLAFRPKPFFFSFFKTGRNLLWNYVNELQINLSQNSEAVCVDEPMFYVSIFKTH